MVFGSNSRLAPLHCTDSFIEREARTAGSCSLFACSTCLSVAITATLFEIQLLTSGP